VAEERENRRVTGRQRAGDARRKSDQREEDGGKRERAAVVSHGSRPATTDGNLDFQRIRDVVTDSGNR
jgi:hypothetical protein